MIGGRPAVPAGEQFGYAGGRAPIEIHRRRLWRAAIRTVLFMEQNNLAGEHPVTEAITASIYGMQCGCRAKGCALRRMNCRFQGHAFEARSMPRMCLKGFLARHGHVDHLQFNTRGRADSACAQHTNHPFYDR